MEVKTRGKCSQIGEYPCDWEVVQVQDVILRFFCGPSPTCEERNIQGEYEWGVLKTTAATKENGWDWTKHKTLPKAYWGKKNLEVRRGDVIVTKAGPRHRVGVSVWVDYVPDQIIVSGKMIGLRPNITKVLPLVLAAAISSPSAQGFIDQRTTGMAESQVNYENAVLLNTPIHIPDIAEQTLITTVLSDMERLLAAADSLIAKKRDLKLAAMQELLTGKARLPGFIDEWEVRRLGDSVQIEKGQLITRNTLSPGAIPVIAGGKKPAYHHAVANRTGRTITISASGANAGYVALYSEPIFASDCSTISESSQYSLDFIYYQLLHLQQDIYKLQTGGAQPHIHAKDLNPIPFFLPNLTEQSAIASVLSDLDAEIDALEARREKTQRIKHGMTQELLSGRIRLVEVEALHA